MRTKRMPFLLALVVCMSAFCLPLTASAAAKDDTVPPKLTAELNDGTLNITCSDDLSGVEAVFIDGARVNSLADGKASVLLKDYAGKDKKVTVYAADYAGNKSQEVTFENPYYEEPKADDTKAASAKETKPAENKQAAAAKSASPSKKAAAPSGSQGTSSGSAASKDKNAETAQTKPQTGASDDKENEESTSSVPEGAFTPEGTGTVLDEADSGDDKQFYTITTAEGNVFYLVIDGKRDANNVYFLNGVTEADLMALAEKDGNGNISAIPAEDVCTCKEKCEAGKVDTDCPLCKLDLNTCTAKAAEPEADPKDTVAPEKENSTGMIVFAVAAMLAAGGIGYYVKVLRPKKQMEDDEFDEDEGYGEGFDPDAAYGETEYLPDDEDGEHKDGV